MIKFIAFLRGINVGGVNIKMAELKAAFEKIGFGNVRTLLASGNVLFDAPTASESELVEKIEQKLASAFGRYIHVLVRRVDELKRLAETKPYAGIEATKQTRLYVTFLPDGTESSLEIPYESPDKNFKILYASEREVCSVLTLSADSQTVDLMSILEKEYGKKVTTRNWNTVERTLKAAG
ncbi:MAG: DUF1697 domain-containing protein [Deferribacteres bacterium]|nr:DUF1697 domain-containing protein [candidate division KSB1 bacterium]MCB9508835.1 DUF1697 domain-containing protein [Deferribacteres bacterium]